MNETQRTVKEVLIQSLNVDQINDLARDVDSGFDLGRISGFGDKIVIPKKTAADCVLQHFSTDQRLLEFVAYMLSRQGQGASGGVIHLRGTAQMLRVLLEQGWIFNREHLRFQRDQESMRTSDWGFLKEEEEYNHSFASIDVAGSSDLIRTNVKADVENSMSRLRSYTRKYVEEWNGRIWFWHGDGGVAAFYGKNCVSESALCMISILSYLPVFNITENELRPENDVKLRVGMHYGSAIYYKDKSRVLSADLNLAQEVEKRFSASNSIALTDTIYNSLAVELRSCFETVEEDFRGLKVHGYHPG